MLTNLVNRRQALSPHYRFHPRPREGGDSLTLITQQQFLRFRHARRGVRLSWSRKAWSPACRLA